MSSSPIITDNYPFGNLAGKVAVMVIHGSTDNINPIEESRRMAGGLQERGIEAEYHTVEGGAHLTAYLDFAPEIFDFLDNH